MSRRLSFSIAVNLLTENFKKGARSVQNSFRSMQMQVLTFAAALGAGGLGLMGLISRFRDVARETSQVLTALKNVSSGTRGFADNLKFVNELAGKYGLEVNTLVGNFAKFTASATQANMGMDQQKKVFESLSRASTAFGLSAQDTNGVFLALSQMMGKGKVSSEELRKQMGERIPIAMQAMAKAAGVSMGHLEKLLQQGKLMSSDIIPKFADALNEMIPNVDTDNLETSLNRLSNAFGNIVDASGFQDKYKALIDAVVSLLEAAGKNVQNIIVGIVAAIGFVITAGLTKVYKNYATIGQQIIANATITHNKLRATVAARVVAEKRLEDLKLQHAQAVGNKQIALAKQIEKAKQTLSARTAAVTKAHEEAKAAAAQAAAIKSKGAWATAGAMIVGTFKRIGAALKSMWASFAPALIISAIIGLIGYFKKLYDEAKRIKNIFSDYKKEAKNVGNTQEVKMLQAQLAIMNDKTKSQKEINAAQNQLNKMLGVEGKNQVELNKLVAKRIELLKKAAQADFYAQKSVESEDKIRSLASSIGLSEEQVRDLAAIRMRAGNSSTFEMSSKSSKGETDYFYQIGKAYRDNGVKGVYDASKADKVIKEIVEHIKILDDANLQLKGAVEFANKNTPTTFSGEVDDKALRAAEKRLEAERKLKEKDRKLKLDKQKFDLEMQQSDIDNMNDSFEKRTKQTLLNLEKEKLAIEEYQHKMLKKQEDYIKTKFDTTADKGKIGLDDYITNFDKTQLPEGLCSEDITKRITQMTDAADAAQEKGFKDINKDLSSMLREQEVIYASDLDRKLSDIDAYYDELRIKAKADAKDAQQEAALLAQIETNRKKEKQEVTSDDTIKRLDFNDNLEQERLAGLESLGMTELVEEKKLKITKKYIEARIAALQPLADTGNEDAKRQIELLQESLKNLDLQKPTKSLKTLADNAIFNKIKKGFEKAGDSASDAEVKTTNLLGAISQKADLVSNITSELKSMFGGLSEELDMAMDTVGNIASGFANGGVMGGAMAIIGEGMKLFGIASSSAARHQEALKEIQDSRIAGQRQYNLLLLEQNLLLKEAITVFGEKQISHATNAMQNYRSSLSNLNNEITALGNQEIVTGHKKTGLFGWGKGKDTYSRLLDVYPEVLDNEGKLNKERLQTVIDTQKMSDETKEYLKNLVNLHEHAEKALDELRNYLQSTFGGLGEDIMDSLENAIKDKGINAWEAFGEAGAKVIAELGKQIAYELFFAKKFEALQKQLEIVYGSGKEEEEVARDAMDVVGKFYQGIDADMAKAQAFLENWQKQAEKYQLELWKQEESTSQDSTKGYSVSMNQETGGAILGRITGIHESILEIKSMVNGLNIDSTKYLVSSISIGDELKKHTGIFYEMQQLQVKSFREIQSISEGMNVFLDIKTSLESINKNTKGLAP